MSVYCPQLAHEIDGTRMDSGCLFEGAYKYGFLDLLILDNQVNQD